MWTVDGSSVIDISAVQLQTKQLQWCDDGTNVVLSDSKNKFTVATFQNQTEIEA